LETREYRREIMKLCKKILSLLVLLSLTLNSADKSFCTEVGVGLGSLDVGLEKTSITMLNLKQDIYTGRQSRVYVDLSGAVFTFGEYYFTGVGSRVKPNPFSDIEFGFVIGQSIYNKNTIEAPKDLRGTTYGIDVAFKFDKNSNLSMGYKVGSYDDFNNTTADMSLLSFEYNYLF
jgi:hypothetical protein